MKLMICGYARHGKDTVADMMGLDYQSSSEVALDEVIWPKLSDQYSTKEECFDDRLNRREEWYDMISEFNREDKARLGRIILFNNDVYVGIRSDTEFHALREQGLFDYSIWVDASKRLPPESWDSNKMEPWMCDYVVDNNQGLDELANEVSKLITLLRNPINKVITSWANSTFPDRTITNALTKMVMEEIPEYLLEQDDELELADVAILLEDIAYLAGIDLEKAKRRKMLINHSREWKLDEKTGLMNHV